MPSTIEQWLRLNAVAGGSARYYHLNELEAWYYGHQYGNLSFTWDDVTYPPHHANAGQPIPLREKAPGIRYPLARRMVDEAADLLVGEGRFPDLAVPDDDTATEALHTLARKAGLTRRALQIARSVITTGGGAVALHFRAGRPSLIYYPAKHCEPVFGDDDPVLATKLEIEDEDLLSLRVQYLYTKEELVAGGWKTIWYAFRRDYTTTEIIHYDTPRVGEDGADLQRVPEFTVTERAVHNYGFVPVEWFRTEDIEDASEGSGLFEHIRDVLRDLDYKVSRMASAADYNTDPLLVFKGLTETDVLAMSRVLMTGRGRTLNLGVNRADNEKSAAYLEITGDSLKVLADHIDAQRNRALECGRVVIQRHEEGAGALSGVSLRLLFRPMIGLIEGYREHFGASFARLGRKLLRAADLRRGELAFELPDYDGAAADVEATWGPVFSPTAEELQQHAQTVVQLTGARALSHETATELTARLLMLPDVEVEKERIKAELAEMVDLAMDGADSGGGAGASGDVGGPSNGDTRDPKQPAEDGQGA